MIAKDSNALFVYWGAVDGASGYEVYYSQSYAASNSTGGTLYAVVQNQTWAKISGLSDGTNYYVRIKSRYSGGTSPLSGSKTGIPGEPENPGIPEIGAVALMDTGKIYVTWAPVANATSYEVWYGKTNSSGAAQKKTGVFGATCMLEDLEDGETYYIWLKGRAGSKESALSQPKSYVAGGRLPQQAWGMFFAGAPKAYLDGHQIGPVSEMQEKFPWNVAGRPDVTGEVSPGRYQKVTDAPYPAPGGYQDSGIYSVNPVLKSGYAIRDDVDQYVFYSGMGQQSGINVGWSLFGIVRAVVVREVRNPSYLREYYTAICEYAIPASADNRFFVMDFSALGGNYDAWYGLMQASASGFSGYTLDPDTVISLGVNFWDAGIAVIATRVPYDQFDPRSGGAARNLGATEQSPTLDYWPLVGF
jgi:hypothetical protein